jgi:hypothetical protein
MLGKEEMRKVDSMADCQAAHEADPDPATVMLATL